MKIVIALFACLSFINCSEDKDDFPNELPAITQEGKDTAGCLVNGDLFLLSGDIGTQRSNPNVSFTNFLFEGYKSINISISDFKKMNKSIVINLSFKEDLTLNQNIPVIYSLVEAVEKVEENVDNIIANASFFSEDIRYETIDISNNYIKFLKIDISNRIISGIFNLNLKSRDSNDIIRLTNGRFDLKINDYIE
ncbi:hypothetical protein [uncultured Tenacibaculum sp.]|uniref:hypothetical protein n=1 Tax=uncultured Tenacibaculum sp. TaxID=174713 RepID=UPI00262CCA46|nr:hypothetical protein [uncultured Tenacibaculum sp.]